MATTSAALVRSGPRIAIRVGSVVAQLRCLWAVWQDRVRQRRQLAQAAAIGGHRFATDTLIERDEVAAQAGKPVWDGAMLGHPSGGRGGGWRSGGFVRR